MNTVGSVNYASYLASHSDNPYHLNHIYEFAELSKKIADERINELVRPMVQEICLKTIKDYLNGNLGDALNYDIHSIASISIKDFNTMFKSEKFSNFISDAVNEEIRKRIGEINLNLML